MFTIALTGGLGAGKSTAARYFRSQGAIVIDSDDVARSVMTEDPRILKRIAEEFGAAVFDEDGLLNRSALAHAAFANGDSAATLNGIVHPAVEERLRVLLGELRSSGESEQVVVIEVPLLVEAPSIAAIADEVVTVEAPETLRVQRVVGRGMAEPDALARIRRQSDADQRAQLADVVIVNSGSAEEFICELERYWATRVAAGGR